MPKKLSLRLEKIASFVPEGCYLGDVGSDHALLPIHLLLREKITYALAIENKMGPYLRMKSAIEDAGLTNRAFCLLSDGISKLNEGVDVLALCGMGGLLACKILEAHPENLSGIKTIIIDPHRDLRAVRKRVSALHYHIVDEAIVHEDKIDYVILRFDEGDPKRPYSEEDLLFGPILRYKREESYLAWLAKQKRAVSDILNKELSKSAREGYLTLYRMIDKEIKRDLSPKRL